jgi:hypothetical protein
MEFAWTLSRIHVSRAQRIPMKSPFLFLFPILLLAGCTTVKYESKTAAGPAKPEDYPIYVYNEKAKIPRAFEVIGTMRVGDTPVTVIGGSLESVMKTLRQNARRKGADALQLTSVEPPGFTSANYRIEANFIRFTDAWESVPRSEEELVAYYQTNGPSLDPIESIWVGNDPTQSRIGVVKDNSKPGREFIALILETKNPSWQRGDKKLDLVRGERPGVYRGEYYFDNYESKKVAITLRGPPQNRFVIHLPNDTSTISFARSESSLPKP